MRMAIRNARIEQVDVHSFVVFGDTGRFGEAAVLYQNTTRKSAEAWIKAVDPSATWTYKPLEPKTSLNAGQVPEYVRELVKGFEFSTCGDYDPGYTIVIRKPRPYMSIPVWRRQIERLLSWAMRYGAEARIDTMPIATRHDWQHAKITITDPVMRILEQVR